MLIFDELTVLYTLHITTLVPLSEYRREETTPAFKSLEIDKLP